MEEVVLGSSLLSVSFVFAFNKFLKQDFSSSLAFIFYPEPRISLEQKDLMHHKNEIGR